MKPAYSFRPQVAQLEGPPSKVPLRELLPRVAAHARVALLDSAGGAPRDWSLLAFDPLPPCAEPDRGRGFGLAALVAQLALEGEPPPWFAGGFIGALAYELGPFGESLTLPPDPWGWPRVVGGLYVDFIVRDERAGKSFLVLGEEPGDARPALAVRRERLLDELSRPAPSADVHAGEVRRLVPAAEHVARIERAREAIAAGECYQANVTHRFLRAVRGTPEDLYRRLVAAHPAPYAGFLRFAEGALLSLSPELLLAVDPTEDGVVARTRPIKGTRPRRSSPDADRAESERLLRSAKDRAELAMIVDLGRNDLGRLARPGAVRVGEFPQLESYVSVHHLAADVSATLAAGYDGLDALEALFPGGSVTGAPKARTMELLAEFEGEGRGFSYGAFGFHGLDGRARWNLLIRSPLWRACDAAAEFDGELGWRVGGGITWSSDAWEEEAESLDKGAPLIAALDPLTASSLTPGMR
ncbi:MAG: anthranilate synthase component I family protein [Planctomycetota bacterium]